jgi:hypothetical protein
MTVIAGSHSVLMPTAINTGKTSLPALSGVFS